MVTIPATTRRIGRKRPHISQPFMSSPLHTVVSEHVHATPGGAARAMQASATGLRQRVIPEE
jgi:hypothetical protein